MALVKPTAVLPPSFTRDGFVSLTNAVPRRKTPSGRVLKHLLVGIDGESDTGKSEFCLSAPGPGLAVMVDRNFDAMLDNPTPPLSRRPDFGVKVIKFPLQTTVQQAVFLEYFNMFRDWFYKALDNPDATTVIIDGDSDSWELQRLAAFGKLANVWPQTKYSDVYTVRRAMIARAWDSGKIVLATNKLKDEYETVLDADGNPVKDGDQDKRQKTGRKERQGFPDTNYLWQIQIRTLYKPPTFNTVLKRNTPGRWGLSIIKCKANTTLVGTELWDGDCNFKGLVQTCYPNIPLEDWGF